MAVPQYIEIHAELGTAEIQIISDSNTPKINLTEASKSSINIIFSNLDSNSSSAFLTCGDVPACETDPIFTTWLAINGANIHAPHSDDQNLSNYINFTTGIKASAIDAGTLGTVSITDDYWYVCVQTGTAGNAIWKKLVMFQT